VILVPPGHELGNRSLAGLLAKFYDITDCLIDIPLAATDLRDNPRDRFPLSGQDDGFAAFYFVEQFADMSV